MSERTNTDEMGLKESEIKLTPKKPNYGSLKKA